MAEAAERYAVVTGANKGIGFATCKQLASKGVTVVLTARDEKKGLEAVDKLKHLHLSGHVLFHQLDVTDPATIASLAHFISTNFGKLDILNGWAKEVLSDAESLTVEKIDNILSEFLKDFKEGLLENKGWPPYNSAYSVSKAALNGYTRIMARTFPSFCINAICPGYVKTNMNQNCGHLTPDEGAQPVVRLSLLPNGSPSGLFFLRSEEISF